jgi:hypothetical protein
MKNNTTKQKKSQPKNEKKIIEDLATNIFNNNDSDNHAYADDDDDYIYSDDINIINNSNHEDISDMPAYISDTDMSLSDYIGPSRKKEEEIIPQRVIFTQGVTRNTAFVVEKHIEEVYNILIKHFGPNNGDFFVGNENTMTQYKNNQRNRYKCIMVTDKFGFNYILWFDITKLGMLY